MILNNDRAAARQCMAVLCADGEFAFETKTLRRRFQPSVLARIKQEEADARASNKAAKAGSLAMMSEHAAQYWEEVQALIARGKAAQASGNKALVDRVNADGERMVERFEELVPEGERNFFKTFDAQDHSGTWDERWSYVEHEPPLLRDELANAYTIPNVRNHAQRMVLGQLCPEEITPEQEEGARKNSLMLRRLAFLDDGMARTRRVESETNAAKRAYEKSLPEAVKKKRAADRAAARKAESGKPSLKTISLADVQGGDA